MISYTLIVLQGFVEDSEGKCIPEALCTCDLVTLDMITGDKKEVTITSGETYWDDCLEWWVMASGHLQFEQLRFFIISQL